MKKLTLSGLLKSLTFILIGFTLIGLTNCGGESDSKTKGEKILDAIAGTWDVPTGGIPTDAAATMLNPKITFVTTSTSATFTSDATSGLDDFVVGGSFSVAADGTVSSPIVNAASGLSFSTPVITASLTEVTISFTASATRLDGVGTWTITVPID
jgi:hypothetical protein